MFHAIFCLNGHFIGSANEGPQEFFDTMRILSALPQPVQAFERKNAFCATCSQPTIKACTHCKSPILVDESRPSYCTFCGEPFPWTESTLKAAKEFADELEELSSDDKVTLKGTFDDLASDSPRTEIAASRFKRILRKLTPDVAEVIRKTIVEIASSTAVKLIKG